MLALSIRQPWAWLAMNGWKDIENRDWPTKVRGRIYIHASKRVAGSNYSETKHLTADIMRQVKRGSANCLWELVYLRNQPRFRPYYGAIIGEIDIIDCVTESVSPWFCGPWGFVLANPTAYHEPVPCKGRLRFWTPDPEIEALCAAQRK